MKYKISVNDQKFEVEIKDIKEGIAEVNVNGQPFDVLIENYEDITAGSTPSGPVATHAAASATATTPAPAPSFQSVDTDNGPHRSSNETCGTSRRCGSQKNARCR